MCIRDRIEGVGEESSPKENGTKGEESSPKKSEESSPKNAINGKESSPTIKGNIKNKEKGKPTNPKNIDKINSEIEVEVTKILKAEIRGKTRLDFCTGEKGFEDMVWAFAEWWITQTDRTIVKMPRTATERKKDWNYQKNKNGIIKSFTNFCGNEQKNEPLRVVAKASEEAVQEATQFVYQKLKRWKTPNDCITYNTVQIVKTHSLEDFKKVISWIADKGMDKRVISDPDLFRQKFEGYLNRAKNYYKESA